MQLAVFVTIALPAMPLLANAQPPLATRSTRSHAIVRDSSQHTSDGPRVIPRVVGLPASSAIDSLRWTELRIVQLNSDAGDSPPGIVTDQRPRAGTPVDRARAETLYVKAPPKKRQPGIDWGAIVGSVITGVITQPPHTQPPRVQPTSPEPVPESPVSPQPIDTPRAPVVVVQDRTKVPNLRENTPEMVLASLRKSRLNLAVLGNEYADDVDSGRVVRQAPAAGTEVATSTRVAVWYSNGPHPTARTYRVPRVLGLTLDEAADSLKRSRFRAGRTSYITRAGGDRKVVSQTPTEGEAAHVNDAIDLTITTPPNRITVPSVTTLTIEAARGRLASAGFGVGRVTLVARDAQNIGIISQRPEGGSAADSGSLVDLVENRRINLRRVVVPNLTGKTVAAADSALKNDSLALGDVLRPAANAADRVIDQRPQPGDSAPMHSSVIVALQGTQQTFRVPGVVSLSVDSARRVLADSGFTQLSIGGGGDTLTSASLVQSQSPPAGTFAPPTIVVSLVAIPPPDLPEVPNLIGLTRAVALAVAEIDSIRLVISTVSKLRLRDEVVNQNPRFPLPRRGDRTIDVTVEVPLIPPLAAAILGLGVIGGAGTLAVKKWPRNGRGPQPSGVVLKPVTKETGPPELDPEGRNSLIQNSLTLRFGQEAEPWTIEVPGDSLVKPEEPADA